MGLAHQVVLRRRPRAFAVLRVEEPSAGGVGIRAEVVVVILGVLVPNEAVVALSSNSPVSIVVIYPSHGATTVCKAASVRTLGRFVERVGVAIGSRLPASTYGG